MKVQVEDVSPIEKRLSIEVEPTFIEKELAQAYAALSFQVKMPGFRPGKIPRRMLEKHYRAEVEADVVKRVQLRSFVDAVTEHQVAVVGDPHFSGGKLEAQKPYAYTARVEVKPRLTPTGYKGLTLKKLDQVVSDEKVAEQLGRMVESRVQVTDVTDREVVQKGDLVTVDFDATVDGQPFPGNTGRDATIEVADGQLIDGCLPQLEGARKGEATSFDYAFPADYKVEEIKGKTAKFTVTVKALKRKQVPALDDAFAQSMGMESLEALKSRLRKDLERARRRELEGQQREDVFTKLAAANPFDVPTALVERGIDLMLDTALGSMSRSGMDLRSLNLDWGKLREELRPRSEVEVRGQLLLEAIGTLEQLTVTDADVEQKLGALAEEAGAPVAAVRKQFATDEARSNLKARLLDEKVIGFITSHATYE